MIKIELDPKRIAEFVDAIEKMRLVAPPQCRCRVEPIKIVDRGVLLAPLWSESLKDKTDRTDRTYKRSWRKVR